MNENKFHCSHVFKHDTNALFVSSLHFASSDRSGLSFKKKKKHFTPHFHFNFVKKSAESKINFHSESVWYLVRINKWMLRSFKI